MTSRLKSSTTRSINTKTLNSSTKKNPQQSITVSEAKNLLHNQTLENIEVEYIKNLQAQVNFLELECNYLREKNDKNNLNSSLKLSTQFVNGSNVGKNLDNIEKILEETQKNFHNEKQKLLDELIILKQENNELKGRTDVLNGERNNIQSTIELNHQELRKSKEQFRQLDAQYDQLRQDNTHLRTELTEVKLELNNRESLINDLQRQIDEVKNKKTSSSELKSTIHDLSLKLAREQDYLKNIEDDKQRLLKEVASYQQDLSEYKQEISRLNTTLEDTLKLNERDLILAKENASLLNTAVEELELKLSEQKLLNNKLQTQIDDYLANEKFETKNTLQLKAHVREVEESLETAKTKINELITENEELQKKQRLADIEHGKLLNENDHLKLRLLESDKKNQELKLTFEENIRVRDHQLILAHQKTEALQKNFDEQINYLKTEKLNIKSLKVQNESLTLQDQSNQKLLVKLKNDINELELKLHQSESKQNEILALRNELESTNSQLNDKDNEINQLRNEINDLYSKLNDTDRLKEIENIIKSQQWEHFGAIAENMKNLSKSITKVSKSSENPLQIGFETLVLNNLENYETLNQENDLNEDVLFKPISEISSNENN